MMEQNNSKLCLCGSGLPYKDCCQNKIDPIDTKMHKAFMCELEKLRRNYRKICLHPEQCECSKQKTHAHTISQKAVLDLIAQDGHVLMPVMYGVDNEFKMKSLGIEADATKLYCFCTKHDAIFYPIDKRNVTLNDETTFLYAYRAFAGTYYKVLRENGIYQKLSLKYDFTKTPHIILMHQIEKIWLNELDDCREIFDATIISQKYNILKTHIIELPYRAFFAVSSCFPLTFDIYGNPVETDIDKTQMLYVSIIPDENSTRIIISWLNRDSDVYKLFEHQLQIVPRRFILKYLNNLLPMNCENMTIGPLLWYGWGKESQQEFLETADCRKHQLAKGMSHSYFTEKSYDLFAKIQLGTK